MGDSSPVRNNVTARYSFHQTYLFNALQAASIRCPQSPWISGPRTAFGDQQSQFSDQRFGDQPSWARCRKSQLPRGLWGAPFLKARLMQLMEYLGPEGWAARAGPPYMRFS